MKAIKLILASGSPRRKELLASLCRDFDIVVPAVEELAWSAEPPASFALRMAHEKALAVSGMMASDDKVCIVAADTIVVLDDRILGKPKDGADAVCMLRDLSGREHTVITGLCVMVVKGARHVIHGDAVRTKVKFRDVSDDEIRAYVATGDPMDKAGAYAIQGGAATMVEGIEGSYTNVIGLPMESLSRIFKELG